MHLSHSNYSDYLLFQPVPGCIKTQLFNNFQQQFTSILCLFYVRHLLKAGGKTEQQVSFYNGKYLIVYWKWGTFPLKD